MTYKSHELLQTHVEEELPTWKGAGQSVSSNLEEIKLLIIVDAESLATERFSRQKVIF